MNAIGIGIVALIVIVLFASYSAGAGKVNVIVVQEKIKQGAIVLDVRTPEEYKNGHYKDARNIPVQELQERIGEVGDKNKAIVVYCASGRRSAQAARLLTAAGFTDVTNAGGLRDLPPAP